MAEVLLFHHAQGLTSGVRDFAETLRGAGHGVHVPDLYEGLTYDSLAEGLGYARRVGFGTIMERGRAAAEALPSELVYAGFSLGVMPAQMLAQTRPGAKGALLFEACIPPSEFGGAWPDGVPVQVHGMDADEFFTGEDLDAARDLVATTPHADLFLYPGDRHLFTDNTLTSYDAEATRLLFERVIGFLNEIG